MQLFLTVVISKFWIFGPEVICLPAINSKWPDSSKFSWHRLIYSNLVIRQQQQNVKNVHVSTALSPSALGLTLSHCLALLQVLL